MTASVASCPCAASDPGGNAGGDGLNGWKIHEAMDRMICVCEKKEWPVVVEHMHRCRREVSVRRSPGGRNARRGCAPSFDLLQREGIRIFKARE